MNYFKEKKFATIAIIVLVILNITTITLLWLGRPSNHRHPMVPREKVLFDFIAHELDFNPVQKLSYEKQERIFMDETRAVHLRIDSIQQLLYNTIYSEVTNKLVIDSLTNIIGSLDAELNRITYNHLVEIKSLCEGNQQEKYKTLLKDVLDNIRPKSPDVPPPRREE